MIVAVLLPRFSLLVALAGERQELLGKPVALAPELGRAQYIGEISPAAEVFGVRAGMRLGEAMARCPKLALVPPDPAGAAEAWERVLAALESIGAAVEPGAPGAVCFDAAGLLGLHGGIDGRARRRPARARAAGAAGGRARRASPRWRRPRVRGAQADRRAGPLGARADREPALAAVARHFLAPLPVACSGWTSAWRRCPSRSSGWGSARWASSRSCRGPRSPTASAPPGCTRTSSRAARRRAAAPRQPMRAAARSGSTCPESAIGPAARARAGPARRPPAGPARAARAHAAGRRPRGDAGRGRHLARAGGVPRGAGRPRAHAARARPAAGRACPRRPRRCALVVERFGPAAADQAPRCSRTRSPSAARACARRSARPAPPPGRRPRCACSRSTRARACPSGARCSRRSSQ